MAPSLDTDSQFRFLISCIKHSNGGKPDFVAVANDLEIVSKAAAAKRFERLMKAHGISTKTALGSGDSSKTPTPKATPAKGRAAKKRKVETDNEDDEAPATPVKKETKVKRETRTKKAIKVKQEEVKEESDQDSDADDVIEDETYTGDDEANDDGDVEVVQEDDE